MKKVSKLRYTSWHCIRKNSVCSLTDPDNFTDHSFHKNILKCVCTLRLQFFCHIILFNFNCVLLIWIQNGQLLKMVLIISHYNFLCLAVKNILIDILLLWKKQIHSINEAYPCMHVAKTNVVHMIYGQISSTTHIAKQKSTIHN